MRLELILVPVTATLTVLHPSERKRSRPPQLTTHEATTEADETVNRTKHSCPNTVERTSESLPAPHTSHPHPCKGALVFLGRPPFYGWPTHRPGQPVYSIPGCRDWFGNGHATKAKSMRPHSETWAETVGLRGALADGAAVQ